MLICCYTACLYVWGMNWTTFITFFAGLYGLWYAGNILKDIVFFKRISIGEDTTYDVTDLQSNEEDVPTQVDDTYLHSINSDSRNRVFEKPKVDNLELEQDTTSIILTQPPQGQGLSLTEFLNQAKEKANISVSKIQYAH